MQLLPLENEVPGANDRVVRPRAMANFFFALIIGGIAAFWINGALRCDSALLGVPIGLFGLFLAWLTMQIVRSGLRGFGRDAWVLWIRPGGLAIKLRSFHNDGRLAPIVCTRTVCP